jgi:serine/threonine protein kinase/DNA-binding SARP family transcriptional activator/WD40 repeat protein
VNIHVLGPVEVTSDRGAAHLGGPKQRAVFAMLVARLGSVVTTDELIDGVWGEDPPIAVLSSLHTYVSNLRASVDRPIELLGGGYRLDAERSGVDGYVFEDDVDAARRELLPNPTAASDRLRRALALWRGRAYADVAGFPGLTNQATRLEELRLTAVESRIEADLTLGRHAALIGELEALAAEHPLRESLRAKHMLALYRDGRQADALRAFRRTQEYLREELGLDPSPELQELEVRILNHDYTLIHSREAVNERLALLFTEIVDSPRLWKAHPAKMQVALAHHGDILRTAIGQAGGSVVKPLADGYIAAFSEPSLAVRAAVAAQHGLLDRDWTPLNLMVRMAVDSGELERRGGDLFGPAMNRGARLLAAAHGGQILLSVDAQRELGRDPGTQVKSLGEHRFKGLGDAQAVFQLVADGLPTEFPPPSTFAASVQLNRRFGDAVRGYELREQIGRGSFATVYRAYQSQVGREVAIKIFRPEVAGHPVFVRRFESDARFAASLAHPHILPLYDYWRDADGAYLVSPLMAGGDLADPARAQLPLEHALRIAAQVGAALSYAHRQGVLHRNVKPANVLFDGDGNAYLADFGGAAEAVEAAAGAPIGAGAYRAPEDCDGASVDARSDIYGLAAVIASVVTGSTPDALDLSAIDPRLRAALKQGLATNPDDRPATADEFLDLLSAATGVPAPARAFRNPYKGLAAFREPDGPDFFGRADEIRRAITMIAEHRLSTVVGPSGGGKSSLVLAGVLPALRAGGVEGSENWVSAHVVPGGHPFDELATALAALSSDPPTDLARELAAPDARGLLRVAQRLSRELDTELLVIVDQLEELFTLLASDETRERFVLALTEAAADPASRIRIVLTLRADFFHEALSLPVLGAIVSSANLALAPLDPEATHEAIVEPAARAGLELEPGLAERIIADLAGQPGSLPLLQFTLDRLAATSANGRLSHAGYEALGGVRGAIADRAEAAYRALTDPERDVARHVFTRLLTVSDDADDLRRRVRVSEFRSLGLAEADVQAVLDTFGRERLLTFDIDPTTRTATVEVAHEALLRAWPTLLAWVQSRRESLILQRRFQAAQSEWEESDRNPANLLVGGRLSHFEEWAATEDVRLTTAEHEFLNASIAQRRAEATARRTRRRRIMTGFAGVAAVAVVFAGVALVLREEAERSATLAEARQAVLEAEANVSTDPELSMLLSLEAIEAFRTAGREPPLSAVATLRSAVNSAFVEQRFPGGDFVAVSPDGRYLATRGEDESVAVWDRAAGELVAELQREGGVPAEAAFDSSGERLVVLYEGVHDGVRAWDWRSRTFSDFGGDPVTSTFVEGLRLDRGVVIVQRLAPPTRAVEAFDLAHGRLLYRLDDAWSPALTADGRLLVLDLVPSVMSPGPSAWEGSIRIVDAATGDELDLVEPHSSEVPSNIEFLSVAPDGTRIALANRNTVALMSLPDGDVIWTASLTRTSQPVWLADGERLLVGGETSPSLLDGSTGEVLRQLTGAVRGGMFRMAAIPRTDLVAAAGLFDAQAVVLTLPPARTDYPTIESAFPYGSLTNLVVVGDGSRLAIADDKSNGVVDATSGRLVSDRRGVHQKQYPWHFPIISRGGLYTAGQDGEGRSMLWSNLDPRVVFTAPNGWLIRGVSDDAATAVIVEDHVPNAGSQPTRLVRTRDGSIIANLDVGGIREMPHAVFSPDGAVVITNNNSGGAVHRVWDTATGALIREVESKDGHYAGWAQEFSPDGTRLVIGGPAGTIWVLDVERLVAGLPVEETVLIEIPAHTNFITHVRHSPDGSRFLSRAHDELVKVWDTATGEKLGEFGTGDFMVGDFHPTEPRLYVPLPGDQIGVYTLDTDDLMRVARSRLTRGLSEEECQTFLGRPCEPAG